MRKTYGFEGRALLLALTLMIVTVGSATAQSQTQRDAWTLSLSVRETRELDRVRNGEPTEDRIGDGADASIGYTTRTERSDVGFFGRVGGNTFRDETLPNQLTYGGGFAWHYQTSELSRMSLTQSVNKNLRLDTLANLGVVPNDFGTLSASTQWSLQGQSGPRTTWSTGLGYNFVELTNAVPIQGSQIVLDEQPFGDQISIPLIDPSAPIQLDLPDGESDILRILATEGLNDPSGRSQEANASFGLNHSISQRTSFGFNVSGGYRSIDTSQARDGAMGAVQIFLQRAITTPSAVSIGYTFQRSFVVDPNTTIQTLFTGWSYSPGDDSRISVSLSGGASRYQAEGLDASIQPVANVEVSGKITDTTSGRLGYRRQFSMPLGFGQSLLIEYADASITQSIGDRIDASATIGTSFGSDPLDDGSKLDTRRAGGMVTFRIAGGLRLGTSFFYVENEQRITSSDFDESYQNWSFFLTYGTNW